MCRCMHKYIQHNNDERTQFFRKIYLLLYWKGCVWEVSWRLNRTATYWPPPNSSGYNSISFPFSWAAQLGAWGPSLCWDIVLIPISSLQLIWTSCRRGYIITYFLRASQFALNSTRRQSRLSPDIFDRMHLLFTQVHLFFWQLSRGQYVTVWDIMNAWYRSHWTLYLV